MKIIFLLLILVLPLNVHAGKLTLLLDWYMNPNHAPLYVAQKFGFFKKKNLEIDIVTPTDLQTPSKLVAMGKADLALTYQYHLHIFVDQGLPLQRIATIIETPLNCLAVKADGPIHKIKDLKGKKIGYKVGLGSSKAFIETLLQDAHLKINDVEMIRSSHSMNAGFLSGQLDAITGVYRNMEPFIMAEKGTPIRLFYYEEHGVPPFDELIVVANPTKSNPHTLKLFVDALEEASQYLVNHLQECLDAYIKDHPEQKNETLGKIWQETLPRFALRPGALDIYRYEQFAQYLKKADVIKTLPIIGSYAKDIRAYH